MEKTPNFKNIATAKLISVKNVLAEKKEYLLADSIQQTINLVRAM